MALRRVGMGRGMAGGIAGGLGSGISGGAFTPSQIAGLAFWVRADAGLYTDTSGTTPVTTDGQAVARWADQSGSGAHCTQATSGLRPVYKTGIRSGLPVVRFDNADDYLDGSISGLGGNSSKTAFVVGVAPASGDRGFFMLGAVNNAFGLASTGGKFRCFQWANDLDAAAGSNNGSWHLVVGKKAASAITIYRDGSSIAGPTTLSASNVASPATVRLGNLNGASWPLGGDLAEILIYSSALSDTDRGLVATYLIAKYAL